jgi:hypothetical protein
MGHVEPVVTLSLSPVGTACQQAVNILLLTKLPALLQGIKPESPPQSTLNDHTDHFQPVSSSRASVLVRDK